MRNIYLALISIFSFTSLNAEYVNDLLVEGRTITGYTFSSTHCYGTSTSQDNKLFTIELMSTSFGKYKDTNFTTSSNDPVGNPSYYAYVTDKSYNGYPCLSDNSLDDSDSIGQSTKIYYKAESDDPLNTNNDRSIYQYFVLKSIQTLATCEDTPSNTTINGLTYQAKVDNDSFCQSLFNDNGDGTNYLFDNPNSDLSCQGFCYYNLPTAASCQDTPTNTILNGLAYQDKSLNDDSCKTMFNNNGDGVGYLFANPNLNNSCQGFCYYNLPDDTSDNTDNTDNSNTNNSNDITALIPYIDEIEEKNQNIVTSIDNLNSNLNTQFNQINTNLENIKNNQNPNEDELTNIGNNFSIDTDITTDLNGFKGDIESSLTTSFSNYSNIFGLDGYGEAPQAIKLNLLGTTYTIFDIAYIAPYVDHIRNIFIVTAYIFGLFLIFRGN